MDYFSISSRAILLVRLLCSAHSLDHIYLCLTDVASGPGEVREPVKATQLAWARRNPGLFVSRGLHLTLLPPASLV